MRASPFGWDRAPEIRRCGEAGITLSWHGALDSYAPALQHVPAGALFSVKGGVDFQRAAALIEAGPHESAGRAPERVLSVNRRKFQNAAWLKGLSQAAFLMDFSGLRQWGGQ